MTIWHRFRNVMAFTVYVTACYLQKSFSFDKEVEITTHKS